MTSKITRDHFEYLYFGDICAVKADPYDALKEKLLAAMKKQDPDEIEDFLNEIDARIPPEKIPSADRPALVRARDLIKRLRANKGIPSYCAFELRIFE